MRNCFTLASEEVRDIYYSDSAEVEGVVFDWETSNRPHSSKFLFRCPANVSDADLASICDFDKVQELISTDEYDFQILQRKIESDLEDMRN